MARSVSIRGTEPTRKTQDTAMIKNCKNHLHDVEESYFEHMGFALQIAGLSFWAGLVLILHAFIPGIFLTDGSRTIAKMTDIIEARKQAKACSKIEP